MHDKIETGAAEPQIRVQTPRPARPGRALRRFGPASGVGRGLLLFASLLVFTLLYALLLQWLSLRDAPPTAGDAALPAASRAVARSGVAGAGASAAFATLDDAPSLAGGLTYTGPWQHLKNLRDGRSGGTSSRSFRTGASATFDFSGSRLRVYGVAGPNGGYAELRIDGETYALLRFYAPHKATNALIYTSPTLLPGVHRVAIIVADAPAGLPKRRFVNLDGVAYAP